METAENRSCAASFVFIITFDITGDGSDSDGGRHAEELDLRFFGAHTYTSAPGIIGQTVLATSMPQLNCTGWKMPKPLIQSNQQRRRLFENPHVGGGLHQSVVYHGFVYLHFPVR